jgi:cephalosporin hydroxylase
MKNFGKTAVQGGLLQAILRTRYIRSLVGTASEIIYWHDYTWTTTKWLGVAAMKYPSDAWTYQEIIFETKPELIIETGTFMGGSALYFASLFDLMRSGEVLTVDNEIREGRPVHPRIRYLTGMSTDAAILSTVRGIADKFRRIMVILDSDHSKANVTNELELYHPFVTSGCYLVVEDTNVNGHPVYARHGPGPMEALRDFLRSHPEFAPNLSRERLGITAHPNGFLLRS